MVFAPQMAHAGASIAAPVLTTRFTLSCLARRSARVWVIDGVSYGAFIIPGLVMLSLLNESISNASFGIYIPTRLRPFMSFCRRLYPGAKPIGYAAAATKSVMLGLLILVTARIFVPDAERSLPVLDDCCADRSDLQPVWFHHWPVG